MKVPAAVTIVIFGGSGDLAHRKLLPALYNLHVDHLLPPKVAVVGVGRKEMSDDDYRAFAKDGVTQFSRRPIDDAAWESFARTLCFVNMSLDDERGFATLGARLDSVEHAGGLTGDRIYYLAIPPALFAPTVKQLARSRLVARASQRPEPFARIIIEKPIGRDLESAQTINDALAEVFDEEQIYRIDHYLGKETVQNILVLRFANSIFEPLFNLKFIDHVQISVAEAEGVGTRAGYYEQAGALRDMIQNHLLQLLALIAMEPPHSLRPEVVRDEKLEILQSLRPMDARAVDSCMVRAQYASYVKEPGVDPGSQTETFVALRAEIDNWRWAGVPFYLRTGKRMQSRRTDIAIQFKSVPHNIFAADEPNLLANQLIIHLQPEESVTLEILSKQPGLEGVRLREVPLELSLPKDESGGRTRIAYERLLLDALKGNTTLFVRRDEVEAAWHWIDGIQTSWRSTRQLVKPYPAGTWGPTAAIALTERHGHSWYE